MSHNPEGQQSAVLDQFLGLITNARPETIPEGSSPLCWDVDFITGAVFTRPGLVSAYTFACPAACEIIQKASGRGANPTISFPDPVSLNSCIAVLCASSDVATSFNAATDSAGQLYNDAAGPSFIGTLQTFWFEKSFSVAGVTSVTVDSNGGVVNVWIYEIKQPPDGSGPDDFEPGDQDFDATDINFGTSATPTGAGLGPDNSFGDVEIYFAVCIIDSHVLTGTIAGWTLDTLLESDRAGVVYKTATGSATQTAEFVASGSANFAMSEVSFYTRLCA